jgi:transposase
MQGYIQGDSRDQALLLPEQLDEYVGPDNPVRFIDAFVDKLDALDLGFERSRAKATGRPGYDPRDLLKLYLYGYCNRTRSSRALERATHVNLEAIWLMRRLKPDHKTIANFRKDNAQAFKSVFRQFTLLCRRLDLVGERRVAIDGTQLKAVNSPRANLTAAKIKRALQKADEDLKAYLELLDDQDAREGGGDPLDREALLSRIDSLEKEIEYVKDLEAQLAESGQAQLSETDPDSRSMAKNPRVAVGYNAQAAADEKHGLIVAEDLVNDVTDQAQLEPMARQASEALDHPEGLEVLADKGYNTASQMAEVEDAGMLCHVPPPASVRAGKLYGKAAFKYLEDEDAYLCPAGKTLPAFSQSIVGGEEATNYKNPQACSSCPIRAKCTNARAGRSITRLAHEEVHERVRQRMKEQPEVYKRRAPTVEKAFGSIKWSMGCENLLVKGLRRCRGEWSLMCSCYNLKRALNLVGVAGLLESLEQGLEALA